MKATFNATALRGVLKNATIAMAARSMVEALDNVYVDLPHVISGDGETTMIQTIDSESYSSAGTFRVLVGKDIISAISATNAQSISIEVLGKETVITAGKTVIKEPSISPEMYPTVRNAMHENAVEIQRETIANVIYCASKDEFRPAMAGVYFDFAAGRIVATDGYRLSTRVIPTVEGKDSVTIPAKTLLLATKMFGTFSVATSEKTISIQGANEYAVVQIIARSIDERYPAYNKVIPKDYVCAATLSKKEMMASIASLMPIASKETKQIRLKFAENLTLTVNDAQTGRQASDEVMSSIDAEAIELGANINYLLDMLKHAPEENITIRMSGTARPLTIEYEEGLSLLMPLRII